MDDKAVLEALIKLRADYFAKLGKSIKVSFFDKEARNLLLELGFSVMDPKGMGRFRKIYGKALKLKVAQRAREEEAWLRGKEKAIADAIKKASGRLEIAGHPRMIEMKGTVITFNCDCGRGKVEIDTAKDMREPGHIKVNGKIPLVHNKYSKEGVKTPIFGKTRKLLDPAILRLAKGARIVFDGITCPACKFRHREYEVAMV